MAYTARVVISMPRNPLVHGRVYSAISRAGGRVERIEKRKISAEGQQQTVIIRVEQAQLLSGIAEAGALMLAA